MNAPNGNAALRTGMRRGWAGAMLVLAALAFAGGYWQLAIARSAPPQT